MLSMSRLIPISEILKKLSFKCRISRYELMWLRMYDTLPSTITGLEECSEELKGRPGARKLRRPKRADSGSDKDVRVDYLVITPPENESELRSLR